MEESNRSNVKKTDLFCMLKILMSVALLASAFFFLR